MWTTLPQLAHHISLFSRLVVHNFIKDDCAYRASALAFVTLLAIVPLLMVGFTILSAFPLFQDLKLPLQNFIFENFVPHTGKMIQIYLQHFVAQVTHLSLLGIVFLLLTAFLLMLTIERSMNTIWHVHTHRSTFNAFLLYWAILSLSPIFLGLSLIASSYLLSLSILKIQIVPSLLLLITPYLLSWIAFTCLYIIVPNRHVKILHGLLGGLIATILFESAKTAFTYYLTHYHFYQLLYGAFATVPLFFIWIYWGWFITLLGAEITYALSTYHVTTQQRHPEHSEGSRIVQNSGDPSRKKTRSG